MNALLEAREPSARYLAKLEAPLLGQFDLVARAPKGVARLRELILSLAVQGKLVPQDSNDEPASLLLERIRAEKARLVKEGKIRKAKPLAAIAEEEMPFALPLSWEWVRLETLTELITSGSRDWAKYHADDGAIFVGMGNLSRGSYELRLNRIQHVAPPKSGEGTRTRLEAFDLLVSITGEVGMLGLIPPSFGEAYINQHTCLIRWLPLLRNKFFPIQLLAPFAQSQFNSPQRGIKNSFRLTDASALLIALPPLAEQSRIVARVEELMALCDVLEAKGKLEAEHHARLVGSLFDSLANSESAHALAENWQRIATHFDLLVDRPAAVDALEQTILQLAVRGLLVPQNPADEPASTLMQKIRSEKDRLIATGQLKRDKPLLPISDAEKPFDLPKGWEWVRLNHLLLKIGAGSTPLGGREVYVSEGIKFLRSQNVWNEGLRLAEVAYIKPETHQKMAGTKVLPGDILFNITGASIGRCAVVPGTFDEANVSQHVTIIRPALSTTASYLHLVLISSHVQQTVMDVQVGVSREGLSIGKLGQFLLPIPPIAEQSRIVARVAELHAICAQLRDRLATTAQTQSRLAETLIEKAVA